MSSAAVPVRTMRAAILTELKQPLVIGEVTLPSELSVGQVLVKILYTGICGSQIGEINGVKGPDKFLPHLLGHEASGTVISVGAGVKQVAPNDTVVLHWMKGEGIQGDPPKYQWQGKQLNAGWLTTFNEYAIVSENRVTKIPASIDLEAASLLGCAVTTGLGVISNNAKVQIGESVVVFGAGGIGLNVIEGAAAVSAHPIIAVDLHPEKLKFAKEFGATHTINSRDQSIEEEVRKILGPSGADVVIDNTGSPKLIELAYSLSRAKGRVVLVGVPKAGDNISIFSLPLHFGKVLTGSHGGESNPTVVIPRYIDLMNAGKLHVSKLVTDRCGLEGINDAVAKMMRGEVIGRCVVKVAV